MAKHIHYNASIQALIKHPHVIHCLAHFELVVNCLLPLFHNMMDKVLSTKEYYSKSRPYKLHQLLNKNLLTCWLPPLHCFTFHSVPISRSLSLFMCVVCVCVSYHVYPFIHLHFWYSLQIWKLVLITIASHLQSLWRRQLWCV